MKELREIRVVFGRELVEISVTYAHPVVGRAAANPGTRKRTTTAARMARAGLEHALEGLGRGAPVWGGFGTSEVVSTDRIVVENERRDTAA